MATWQDLAGYIRSHYKIAEENGAININEFERPLMLVTGTADALEKKFAGTDNY